MAPLRTGQKGRKPVPSRRLLAALAGGVCIGWFVGYIILGSKSGSAVGVQQGLGRGAAAAALPDTIHTLCTGNGSPYQNYQLRIAYATYRLVQRMPGGERHVAFTRILHRTKPDALMGEIETFRADPLQPKCDDWCEYPVSDRGNAVRQFFDAAAKDPSMIKGEWLYMIESDYVFMKPLPLPDAQSQAAHKAWGYPFDYINPKAFPQAMRKLYPVAAGPVEDIPGTGPAPMLMRAVDWIRVTPDWERLTAQVEADEALKKQLGWVREMYAFSVALALNKLKVELKPPGQTQFIAQLPIDNSLGQAHAFHYTQCTIYKTLADNKDVWAYDKRFHTSLEESLKVPPIPLPPTFQEGKWKFIEGKPVNKEVHAAIEQMIGQMNAGIAMLQPIAQARR
ncbi:hypothetical protein ABPG77_011414 [Micractinium sp. CCAP 211/92]